MPFWAQPGVGRADGRTRRAAPEKALDAACCRYLRMTGWAITRLQQARPSHVTAGIPDLFLIHPERRLACWIELKAPGGRLSPAQVAWHTTARAAGQTVLVVHSVEELIAGLAALGAPRPGGTP